MPRTDLTWRTRRPEEGFYTSIVEAPESLPVRTFLPTGYEPNYPYPLLVLLHGHGGERGAGASARAAAEPAELHLHRPSRSRK